MRSFHRARNYDTQSAIQAQIPTVEKAIINWLNALRDGSMPLTLVTVRGIVVATLMSMAPEVFEIKAPDGSTF
jgi:hypothetical protein